jgi:hypothetical protein
MLKEHGAHNYCISLMKETNQLFAYVEIEVYTGPCVDHPLVGTRVFWTLTVVDTSFGPFCFFFLYVCVCVCVCVCVFVCVCATWFL